MNIPLLSAGEDTAAQALLTIGALRLVLPRGDVCAVEAAADVDSTEPVRRSVGWIPHAQQRWPAYCLDPELALLPFVPPERRACVLLAWGGGYVGLLCDEVGAAKGVLDQEYALPRAMAVPESPISHVAPHDGGIACISDAQRLAAHVVRLAVR